MTTPYAEGLPLPDDAPDETDPVDEAPAVGGLVPLGSPDGVVCEDGVCWAPDFS